MRSGLHVISCKKLKEAATRHADLEAPLDFSSSRLVPENGVSMTPEKTRRVVTAVGFLSGVLVCMDAVRDAGILWPPDAVWEGLRSPQRLELGVGIALLMVSFVTSLLPRRQGRNQ